MPDWEHTTWIRVTLFFSFLLVNSLKSYIRVDLWWWMYEVGSGISFQWVGCGWMMGCWRGERLSFYSKIWGIFAGGNSNWGIYAGGILNHVFWLVRIWSWTIYSDWSELNHSPWLVRTWWVEICELNRELWLVRTWWLKISELNRELWLVRTWWLKIYELNHVLWLVRTWGLKNVSWTMSCDWSELDEWILQADWPRLIMYL